MALLHSFLFGKHERNTSDCGVHRHPREFQSPSSWVGGVNYRTKLQNRIVSRVLILLQGSRDMKIEGFGCAAPIEETNGFKYKDTADRL